MDWKWITLLILIVAFCAWKRKNIKEFLKRISWKWVIALILILSTPFLISYLYNPEPVRTPDYNIELNDLLCKTGFFHEINITNIGKKPLYPRNVIVTVDDLPANCIWSSDVLKPGEKWRCRSLTNTSKGVHRIIISVPGNTIRHSSICF